jgi:hypothetical protein
MTILNNLSSKISFVRYKNGPNHAIQKTNKILLAIFNKEKTSERAYVQA